MCDGSKQFKCIKHELSTLFWEITTVHFKGLHQFQYETVSAKKQIALPHLTFLFLHFQKGQKTNMQFVYFFVFY